MVLNKLEKIGKVELNTIYNLDFLIGMEFIADKSVDLILCDLPYG
jgi:site-specific DNA-methyltransferase (adenine-specific)